MSSVSFQASHRICDCVFFAHFVFLWRFVCVSRPHARSLPTCHAVTQVAAEGLRAVEQLACGLCFPVSEDNWHLWRQGCACNRIVYHQEPDAPGPGRRWLKKMRASEIVSLTGRGLCSHAQGRAAGGQAALAAYGSFALCWPVQD
jgi:hypothetical protein